MPLNLVLTGREVRSQAARAFFFQSHYSGCTGAIDEETRGSSQVKEAKQTCDLLSMTTPSPLCMSAGRSATMLIKTSSAISSLEPIYSLTYPVAGCTCRVSGGPAQGVCVNVCLCAYNRLE